MPSIDWQLAAAIATVVSTIAFAVSAIVVALQLRQASRERYFSVTAHLFEIWQSPEFQHDQLFLLHKLSSTNWDEFCAGGRGEHPERAIHRVGGYYDRVGNLVRHNLIHKQDILPTIGGYAVAVWHRIEPLVKELRLRENAVLFQNYEALLPECHECYVPGIASRPAIAVPLNAVAPAACAVEVPRPITVPTLPTGTIAPNFAIDGRTGRDMAMENRSINGSGASPDLSLPDTDGIPHSLSEFTSSGLAVLVYARGAWCPFCLRQLADYGERYGEFKRAGIEVVALSPESPRKARRMRTGLKLPFTVLTDVRLEAARKFGLMDHEKPGAPTPATLLLDSAGQVRMTSMNQLENCLLARDALECGRTLKQSAAAPAAIPPPAVGRPQPGWLFARAIANMAVGLVSR
jgi:peroxiredoxin